MMILWKAMSLAAAMLSNADRYRVAEFL